MKKGVKEEVTPEVTAQEVSESTDDTAGVLDLLAPVEESDEEIVDVVSLDKIRETLLAEEASEDDESADLDLHYRVLSLLLLCLRVCHPPVLRVRKTV